MHPIYPGPSNFCCECNLKLHPDDIAYGDGLCEDCRWDLIEEIRAEEWLENQGLDSQGRAIEYDEEEDEDYA